MALQIPPAEGALTLAQVYQSIGCARSLFFCSHWKPHREQNYGYQVRSTTDFGFNAFAVRTSIRLKRMTDGKFLFRVICIDRWTGGGIDFLHFSSPQVGDILDSYGERHRITEVYYYKPEDALPAPGNTGELVDGILSVTRVNDFETETMRDDTVQ